MSDRLPQIEIREPAPRRHESQLYPAVASCLIFAGWITPCISIAAGTIIAKTSESTFDAIVGFSLSLLSGMLAGLLFLFFASITLLLISIDRNTDSTV